VPTFLGAGVLEDDEKYWLPDEYAGGTVRWAGATFPITSNTTTQLTVIGDPSLLTPTIDMPWYQVIPPAVAGLTEFLQVNDVEVLTAFAQVPTKMPAITIRLERDSQGDTYLGESLKHYATDGVEFDVRQQTMTGAYLLSLWTVNREATLWAYAWLQNWALNSMGLFSSWGLYDVTFAGSDLDPALQYLAERTYTRHMLFTATRMERAVMTRNVEWVSRLCIKVCAEYARLTDNIIPVMD
jgi:hypothetical protein